MRDEHRQVTRWSCRRTVSVRRYQGLHIYKAWFSVRGSLVLQRNIPALRGRANARFWGRSWSGLSCNICRNEFHLIGQDFFGCA